MIDYRLAADEETPPRKTSAEGYMDYHQVSSSSIAAIAYQASTSTLRVRFRKGNEYSYTSVPERVFCELLSADSIGQYFNTRIRNVGYTFERVQ